MNRSFATIAAAVVTTIAAALHAGEAVPEVPPFPLPTEVQGSLSALAAKCDVLILGETHGTREAPAIVATLLDPLTKLGYRVIALEVPRDQQAAMKAWASGKTDAIPKFFANPGADGRGNREVLALVRRALQPPFEWNLICFDQTEQELMRQMMERLPKDSRGTIAEQAARLSPSDFTSLSVARDAAMAQQLAAAMQALPAGTKVLAICGNLHARTADHSPEDSPVKPLWPSTAAVLARDHPEWRIRSFNLEAFSGEYFNGGKVNRFARRSLDRVAFRLTPNGDWDAELHLPQATVATFLAPPSSMKP